MMQQVIDLRAAKQGLGGNAAPVEADAAQVLALDHDRLHAELGRPDGRDVAARATADDRQNEGLLGHGSSPFPLSAGYRRRGWHRPCSPRPDAPATGLRI